MQSSIELSTTHVPFFKARFPRFLAALLIVVATSTFCAAPKSASAYTVSLWNTSFALGNTGHAVGSPSYYGQTFYIYGSDAVISSFTFSGPAAQSVSTPNNQTLILIDSSGATIASKTVSNISYGAGVEFTVTLTSPVSVSAGTYFVGFKYNSGNFLMLGSNADSVDHYSGGCMYDWNGSGALSNGSCPWQDSTHKYDLYFKISGSGQFSAPTDPLNGTTHIISFTPSNNSVNATTSTVGGVLGATTTISVNYEIAASDLTWFTGISTWVENTDMNYVWGFRSLSPYSFVDTCQNSTQVLCTAGVHTYNRDIWLPAGGYEVHVKMQSNILGIPNPITSIVNWGAESQDSSMPMAQYHQYKVVQGTFISDLQQNFNNNLENILAATTTSTSSASVLDCNILYGFDFKNCMAFTFIPTSKDIKDFGNTISQSVFSKFPAGYIWNFYTLLLSTSTASLPVISATVPNGVAGAGAHIDLSLTGTTLNYLWNATTSQFVNSSASSTASLVTIVGYYWNIIVYLAVAGYILSRILGSHVVGTMWSNEKTTAKKYIRKIKGN